MEPYNFDDALATLKRDFSQDPPRTFPVILYNGTHPQCVQILVACCTPWIHTIRLQNCDVTDDDINTIVKLILLRPSSRLECLDLSSNRKISHTGVNTLANALNHKNARSIRTISLRYCPINDIGACNLLEALHHPDSTVRTLNLCCTNTTDITWRYCADMLEDGNLMRLDGQMLATMRTHIGQHAMSVLHNYIRIGNCSLRFVYLSEHDSISLHPAGSWNRIEAALEQRNGWDC